MMNTKEEKIKNFNVNGIGLRSDGLYGLPFTAEESETIALAVPWDVTVSYAAGTAQGPEAIFNASYQVDLLDPVVPEAWKKGIAMVQLPGDWLQKGKALRKEAETIIQALESGDSPQNPNLKHAYNTVEAGCHELHQTVESACLHWLNKGKRVVLVGGDHSTPLGYLKALSQQYPSFGILQIDAHADLRESYEGFCYSHASIMYNALKIKAVERLVQVGIRDYCEEEARRIAESEGRIVTFFDHALKRMQYAGDSWDRVCNRILASLPDRVYLSFDIDGLDPKLCPHTGTPVAGGFETEQLLYLIEKLVKSGKKIIGMDLNEVAPGPDDDWDANVAARLLYRMCNLMSCS